MESDERLTALKRVYADIILNTAKEAAARIMVSEQKSVRFKKELHVAKEEALRMLMRLKQMIDSKISEAELTSLSQQRKIEELEAQLQEAEDIVYDLRVEVREVQAELEKVTSSKEKEVQNMDERDTATPGEQPDENRIILPPESCEDPVTISNTNVTYMNQKNEGYQSCCKSVHLGSSYVTGPDLPSIILKSKEPESYRNGCTQRMRACEGNILDGELSVSGQVDKRKNENGDAEDESERISSTSIHKADDMVNPETEALQTDSLLSNWHSFHRKRRRARSHRKTRNLSQRNTSDCFPNSDEMPNNCCMRAHSFLANDYALTGVPSEMVQRLSTENAEPGMKLGFADTCENKPEPVESSGVQNGIDKDRGLLLKIEPPKEESGSMESLEVPIYKTDLEKVSDLLLNSKSKVSDVNNGVPCQLLNDRVIKYTFQRKRKREALSVSDENASIEMSTSKKNEEKLNGHMEPQKSSSQTESSLDCRQMEEVSQQLISV